MSRKNDVTWEPADPSLPLEERMTLVERAVSDVHYVLLDENRLDRSVNRLGDTAGQLTEVLGKVDENQKTLLRLRLDVDRTALKAARLDTQTQLAKARNKTAVLVILIMIVTSVFGVVSYTRVRSDANATIAATQASYAVSSKCQIDFNTKVLSILEVRGVLDNEDQKNLTLLLGKIAIPGSSFEQGQAYRREFVAQSMAIQAHRSALVFPKLSGC